jgi:hypothetical protein
MAPSPRLKKRQSHHCGESHAVQLGFVTRVHRDAQLFPEAGKLGVRSIRESPNPHEANCDLSVTDSANSTSRRSASRKQSRGRKRKRSKEGPKAISEIREEAGQAAAETNEEISKAAEASGQAPKTSLNRSGVILSGGVFQPERRISNSSIFQFAQAIPLQSTYQFGSAHAKMTENSQVLNPLLKKRNYPQR